MKVLSRHYESMTKIKIQKVKQKVLERQVIQDFYRNSEPGILQEINRNKRTCDGQDDSRQKIGYPDLLAENQVDSNAKNQNITYE